MKLNDLSAERKMLNWGYNVKENELWMDWMEGKNGAGVA